MILSVQVLVIVEELAKESIFLHNFDVIHGLFSKADNSPELISVLVFFTQVFVTSWDNTRLLHEFLVLHIFSGELLVDKSFSFLFSKVLVAFLFCGFD